MRRLTAGLSSPRAVQTAIVVAGITAAFALMALATLSGPTHDVVDRANASIGRPTGLATHKPPPTGTATSHDLHGASLLWLQVLLWTIGVVVVLSIVIYIVILIATVIRNRGQRVKDDEFGVDVETEPDAAAVARRLAETVDEALDDLNRGSARDVILACWLRLEDVAKGVGVPRRVTETAAEFTERVLATCQVDRPALSELADLYREARFSSHVMGELQRESARAALTRVRDDLAAHRAIRVGVGLSGDSGEDAP
jgi:hypothetical protein